MKKKYIYGLLSALLFLLLSGMAVQAKSAHPYEKLQTNRPVRIAVFGDSIADKTGVEPALSWDSLLYDWLLDTYPAPIVLDSYAIGGTSSYTGYYQSETAMRKNIRKNGSYDLILICYGQNDSPDNFGLYYEAMLRSILRQNPSCRLITILESSQQIYTEKMLEIIRLSGLYDADIADTIGAFSLSEFSFTQLTPDGTHPDAQGHRIYFETIRSVIESGVTANKNASFLATPSNPFVSLFEDYTFIPLEKCRTDDGQYRITPKTPTLGILYQKFPGGSDIWLEFSTGEVWADTGDTTVIKKWTMAAPVGLLIAPNTTLSLQYEEGIEDTVLGFICSGHLPY